MTSLQHRLFHRFALATTIALVACGSRISLAGQCVACHAPNHSSGTVAHQKSGGIDQVLVGYNLRVAEDLNVLLKPKDIDTAWMAAWRTPGELMTQRDAPYFVLENTSTKSNGGSGKAQLSQFTISIGDKNFNFDWLKINTKYTSPGVKLLSVTGTDTVQGGKAGDTVVLKFSGFEPGMRVVFQVDIDPDKANAFPLADYRTVLFTLNGGDNPAGNSQTSASFFDPSLDPAFQKFSLPKTYWDNPDFDKKTAIGMDFTMGYMEDHVAAFDTHNFGLVQVPEPQTLVLISTGVVFVLLAWRWEARRQAAVRA